jgi:hypothetical protein
MTNTKKHCGLVLATTAAALFAGSAVNAADAPSSGAMEAPVHCGGVTSCKGHSDCATADNACKGQNSCKGKGFKLMSAEDCTKAGGKILK